MCHNSSSLRLVCLWLFTHAKETQGKNELLTLIQEFIKPPQVALKRYVFGFCACWSIWGPRTARQRHLNLGVARVGKREKDLLASCGQLYPMSSAAEHQEIKRPNELNFVLVMREKAASGWHPRRIVAFVLGLN